MVKNLLLPASFVMMILGVLVIYPSTAFAVKVINLPYVTEGETKIGWVGSYDTDDKNKSKDGAQAEYAKISYGVTSYWSTELQAEALKSGSNGSDFDFTSLEWQNKFQFTGVNDWIGSAIKVGYHQSFNDTPNRVYARFILAKDIGKIANTTNFVVSKELGADGMPGLQTGFAWGSRYKWSRWFEPGFEFYDDLGQPRNPPSFTRQSESIGPVFYGQITPNTKYEIGYLFGITDISADGELKARLDYKF